MDATTKQQLRDWYASHIGYDPIADNPSMTDEELCSLCSGFAAEAAIADPTAPAADAANLCLAKQLAATIGRKQFWKIQYVGDAAYIVSDPVAQCSGVGRGRYMVTDGDAVDRARKAGIRCEDDGRIV